MPGRAHALLFDDLVRRHQRPAHRPSAARINGFRRMASPTTSNPSHMSISTVPNVSDPFAPLPLPGEEPGVQLNEIPDPPPEENN